MRLTVVIHAALELGLPHSPHAPVDISAHFVIDTEMSGYSGGGADLERGDIQMGESPNVSCPNGY